MRPTLFRRREATRKRIPKDHPIQPLAPGEDIYPGKATCGTCGLSWDDSVSTSLTPTPAGRCPFEAFHTATPRAKKPKEETVTAGDLPDLTGHHLPGGDPFLLCERCWSQHSANSGDYWNLPSSHVFRCCGEPMRLVTKVVRFVDWRKPKAKGAK